MAAAMLAEAVLTYTLEGGGHDPSDDMRRLALLLGVLLVFVSCFSASWGVATWIASAELAPLRCMPLPSPLPPPSIGYVTPQLRCLAVRAAIPSPLHPLELAYDCGCIRPSMPSETSHVSLENVGALFASRTLASTTNTPPRRTIVSRLRHALGVSSSSSSQQPPQPLTVEPLPAVVATVSSSSGPLPPVGASTAGGSTARGSAAGSGSSTGGADLRSSSSLPPIIHEAPAANRAQPTCLTIPGASASGSSPLPWPRGGPPWVGGGGGAMASMAAAVRQ